MRNPVARHLAQSRRRSSVVPNKKWFPTEKDWVEEQLEMFDDEDPFNTWKAEVDRICIDAFELSSEDLPDDSNLPRTQVSSPSFNARASS